MTVVKEEHFAHYGTPRKSGRYPWGSGGTNNTKSQKNRSFLDVVQEQKKSGLTDSEIAKLHGLTRNELTAKRSIQLEERRQDRYLTAFRLREKGMGYTAIGEKMGLPESTVRSILAPGAKDKTDVLQNTANMLRGQVDEKGMIDVGLGVEAQLGISRTRLDTSIAILKEEGYSHYKGFKIPQVTQPGKLTTMQVLAPPGTTFDYVSKNRNLIRQIDESSQDHGRSYNRTQPPLSVNSRRVGVISGTEGAKTDGMIYIRPGVKNLSIGNKRYGQVRIMVDGTHYIKGMAIYDDTIPAGKDIMFSTKQTNLRSKKDAMKPITDDPELPFGALIRQSFDENGKLNSAVNLVGVKEGAGEEGSWDTWRKSLSSQMLSKQSPELATQQLKVTYERRLKEFDEINSLTNPTVRKDLLNKFADSVDYASVHMHGAAMPKQATKVLLPIPSMKPDEIYAPHLKDGDRVALVRHPHGGKFEIPQLTVNNRNREARRLIGTSPEDAVGINHQVAHRLSGADFDGDTVLVIPNKRGEVKNAPALEGLKDFDPMSYKLPDDSPIPRMTSQQKGQEMGKISNLITDMSLQGAGPDHLARALRHSMVVIDAEKHGLNYKQSEKDNAISSLKEEYQGGKGRGAQTIISRATADVWIPERELRPASEGGPIDPNTGRKVWVETGRMKVNRKTGKLEKVEVPRERLSLVEDALDILPPGHTPTQMELIYANHSNSLKALANQARKEAAPLKGMHRSPSAAKVYAAEVTSLDAKIRNAERNAPRERQAQVQAGHQVSQRKQANPNLEKSEEKKIRQDALNKARIRTGAERSRIQVTDKEWEAIQNAAISTHKLEKILKNSDPESIKMKALPKEKFKMTSSKVRRAKQMLANGFTQAEVADHLGVGLTTLKVSLQ